MPKRSDLDSDGYARRYDFWPRREGEAQEAENEGTPEERAAAVMKRAEEAQSRAWWR